MNEKLSSENLLLFTKMVEAFNISLLDVLEQEDEMELIMDVFNQKNFSNVMILKQLNLNFSF